MSQDLGSPSAASDGHAIVIPIIQREDYQIAYERVGGITLAHSQVRKWTAQIARRYVADLDMAQGLLGEPLYVIDNPESPLLPKFLRWLKFRPCGTVRDLQGRDVMIYERSPNG